MLSVTVLLPTALRPLRPALAARPCELFSWRKSEAACVLCGSSLPCFWPHIPQNETLLLGESSSFARDL